MITQEAGRICPICGFEWKYVKGKKKQCNCVESNPIARIEEEEVDSHRL